MNFLLRLVPLTALLLNGCAFIYGATGADEGQRINNDWMAYHVKHPGLTITILEPYSPDLLPINTVGKTSPAPLHHTVIYGVKSKPHTLEIIGKYDKEVYLDGKFYGSLYTGDILINAGIVSIDGKVITPKAS